MSITKLQKLIERTAEEFGVCPRAIISKDSTRPVTAARAVVAFLLKDEYSTAQIGSLLGRRNGQYKNASVRKVYAKSKEDHRYFVTVMKLAEEFGVEWA